mgnify:CR=1 FL=1
MMRSACLALVLAFASAAFGGLLPQKSASVDLWTVSSGIKVMRDDPLPREPSRTVRLALARNEYEAVQLVVRARKPVADVRVCVKADGLEAEVLRVGYVRVTVPTDEVGKAADYPDPLPPQEGRLPVAAGTNQPFWIRVRAPKDAVAGLHRGTVGVTVDGKTLEVPLEVEVFGFALPDTLTCQTAFGFEVETVDRYHGLKTTEDRRTVWAKYLRELSRHHISPYNPVPHAGWSVRWKGLENPLAATPQFDFAEWDAAMEKAFADYHFNTFQIQLEGLGGGDWQSRWEPEYKGHKEGTPEYEALMSKYLGGIESHLKERGWLDKGYVYWYDEPQEKDYGFVKNGFAKLKRWAPGLRRLLTDKPTKALLGGPNLWCPLTRTLHSEAEPEARKLKDRFWWYVCMDPKAPYATEFIDHPGLEMRLWLWQTWGEKVLGILMWNTTWWTSASAYPDAPQNPYLDPMGWEQADGLHEKKPWGNGDGRFFYPPPAAADGRPGSPVLDGPVVSYRMEMIRDGLEDYEYFVMLKRLLAKRTDLPAAESETLRALLAVPKSVSRSLTDFTTDPAPLEAHRIRLARAVERLVPVTQRNFANAVSVLLK